jgi:hypothetical protein
MELLPGGVLFSTRVPTSVRCLDTSGAPSDMGGTQVLVTDGGATGTCRNVFEVQLYSDDAGRIVAVNWLTPHGSWSSTGS